MVKPNVSDEEKDSLEKKAKDMGPGLTTSLDWVHCKAIGGKLNGIYFSATKCVKIFQEQA